MIGVTNGLCNAAVVGQADWNIYSQTTAGNAGCGLYLTGTIIIKYNQSIVSHACISLKTCMYIVWPHHNNNTR